MAKKHSIQQMESDRKHSRKYGLKLNRERDGELIEWLDAQDSKNGTIKQALYFYREHGQGKD